MVAILSRLRRRAQVVIECRRCGTTVGSGQATCPNCGGSGLAEYVIPP